jgi:hypothetical protein
MEDEQTHHDAEGPHICPGCAAELLAQLRHQVRFIQASCDVIEVGLKRLADSLPPPAPDEPF